MIEWWKADRLVGQELEFGTATAEDDNGAEDRVAVDTDQELDTGRKGHHGLHQNTFDIGVGTMLGCCSEKFVERSLNGAGTVDIEPHSADV